MAKAIVMPRQGNTVESCIILEWKKQEGDTVAEGDVIAEVETDKATFEVEATAAGTLLKVFFAEGDDVPVLTPIAVVGEDGEDFSGLAPEKSESAASPQTPMETAKVRESAEPQTAARQIADGGDGRIAISPRARNLATGKGLNINLLEGRGSGPGGRIIEQDVKDYLIAAPQLTPAAVAKLAAGGVVAPEIGTGIGGRVLSSDLNVADAVASAAADAVASAAADAGAGLEFPGPLAHRKLKGVRKLIAERMHASLETTAQLTLHASADARSILGYRAKLKASAEELGLKDITINDLVLYAAIRTLTRYPALNATFVDDTVTEYHHVHAAFAVDTDRGLMVPVVRFSESLSLRGLAAETKRLSGLCLQGNINPDELSGGTITVTNLGALGVEMFTPILNAPQVAILGVNTIQPKAVMNGSEVAFYPHVGLSLTIDHQVVDGGPAARYLRDLCNVIADFELALAG
ncbi:MAG: hypothetical protein CMN78_05795 [Spirochaetales bacterium]|nr:hypothetical protein [Spirochaetales bacterium]